MPWTFLSEEHRQTITNLCRRPTLLALTLSQLFLFPPELIFNPELKISSLCVQNTSFLLANHDGSNPFAKYLQSVAYLTSLRHIEVVHTPGLYTDSWVQPVVQAAASSGSLTNLKSDFFLGVVWL